MSEQYKNYSKQDFLEDAFFLAYIKRSSIAATSFWEMWAASSPANIGEMQAAAQELRILLSAKRIYPAPALADEIWAQIAGEMTIGKEEKRPLRSIHRRLIAAAAAVLLLLIGTGIFRYTGSNTIATGYGKTLRIQLSDQSQVTLNANSSITYAKHWWGGSRREVWLSGEAFFEVVHLKQDSLPVKEGERFVVHTRHLDVEVLGTRFNVKERRGITQVGLTTGAVQLRWNHRTQSMQLQPGEQASYESATGTVHKAVKDMNEVNAWKENKLVMNNASVGEIIQLLEDNYGYKAVLEDPSITNRTIQGTIPVKNEDNIIFILSGILKMNIEKKDSLLIFRRAN